MSKKPNLLFIFADQWRRHAVGFAKEDQVVTPNMDKFAEKNLVLNNALSCCPLCSPHRAALLTGRYPITNGVFTNCKTGSLHMLKEEEICISDVLKENDYQTGYIGKWHLDLPELNLTDTPESGVVGWDAFTPPGKKRHGFDFWYSYGAMDKHLHPHYWKDTPKKIQIEQWSPEHETDVAIDYINEAVKSEEPFALFVSWNPPHSPYDQVPQKYQDIYKDKEINFRKNVEFDSIGGHTHESFNLDKDKLTETTKNYFAAITGLDDNFGRLLETLKSLNIDDNTIVVLSADHGDMMGSHGLMAKHVWYEESIGIPFVIGWPGHLKGGIDTTLLNSVDVMPTLLSLMSLEVPTTVEGIDISANLKGEESVEIDGAFIHAYPGRDIFLNEYKERGMDPKSRGWRGVRTKEYTYVIHKGYWPTDEINEVLLYDLEKDPYQLNPEKITNVENHPIAKKLHQRLLQFLEETKDPFEI